MARKGLRRRRRRFKVRVECARCASGYVGHMTVAELRERALGEEFDARCPECGQIHLTREEIEELEHEKITQSEAFKKISKKAEVA